MRFILTLVISFNSKELAPILVSIWQDPCDAVWACSFAYSICDFYMCVWSTLDYVSYKLIIRANL